MPKYYVSDEYGEDGFVINSFDKAKKCAEEEASETNDDIFIYELKLVGKVVASKPTFVLIEGNEE